MSLHFLYRRKTNSTASRITIIYTWSMLLITIVWIYCNTRISEVQLLEDSPISANHPEILSYCSVTNIAGTLSATLLFFGSDALLVNCKVYTFWRPDVDACCSSSDSICSARGAGSGSQFPAPFTSRTSVRTPGIAVYACVLAADGCASGIGIAINLVCFSPEFGGHLPLPPLNLLANVFYIATAAVPTILTPIICSKLLLHRHRMAKQSEVLRGNSTLYLSIVAVVVESAIPYVLCSWIWVALFITNNRAWVWFEGFLLATSVRFFCDWPSR
jgi:hypothetical protein